jgi:TonB family protein
MYPASSNNGSAPFAIPAPVCVGGSDQMNEFLRHFGFEEPPFGVTPNPAFLFSSTMHLVALRSMVQSIESNLGFTVLLGAPGMGKTTVLLQLLTQYRDSARTAFIFQTQCKRYELLRYLASELDLPVAGNDEVLLHQRLKEVLVKEACAGRKVLVFIDEAQNLQRSSLEAIRLLSDFETPRAKLLHIILAGSSRLGETLLTPELSQLAQRISTVCRLGPLNREEVSGYVLFRLRVAGCDAAESLFSPEALAEIAQQSAGVPRLVNTLCYRALALAHDLGERHVTGMLIQQAASDLDLSHATAGMHLGLSRELPPSERMAGTRSSSPLASEQRHEPFDLQATSVKPHEQENKISAPSAPTSFAVYPGGPGQPASNSAQEAHGTEDHVIVAAVARGNSTQPTAGSLDARPKPDGSKSHRAAIAMAALALFALGLWAGWRELRVKPGVVSQTPAAMEPAAGSPANAEPASSPSNIQNTLPTATAEAKASPDSKPVAGNQTSPPSITALTQNVLPSKLRSEQANPTEMAVPAIVTSLSTVPNLAMPPATVPRLAPTPSQPRAPTVAEEPAKANEAPEARQTSLRSPIKTVQPKYPKLAELRQIEGDVLLELHVDPTGRVKEVRALSGNSLLTEAAEEAARQWLYPPVSENQPPMTSVMRVRFNFKLNPDTKTGP